MHFFQSWGVISPTQWWWLGENNGHFENKEEFYLHIIFCYEQDHLLHTKNKLYILHSTEE